MSEKKHLDTVSHDFIRYANVWEDAYLLTQGLEVEVGHRVLSIASAGDNSLFLLAEGPELVVAIDVNKAQLYLSELKKVAVKYLTLEEYEALFGFVAYPSPKKIYASIATYLSSDGKQYWDHRFNQSTTPLLHDGKFERYLRSFATKVLPWIHSKKRVEALFETKSAKAQQSFYEELWYSARWRFLFKIFFSKSLMGLLGRDPAFLKEVDTNVGQTIMDRAGAHLSSQAAQTNPILRYCLTGSFGDLRPHYLQPENFQKIKNNIDALHIVEGYAQDAKALYGHFDRFNLSNIFEYMDPKTFKEVSLQLLTTANKGARFAYWNLMVHRLMSDVLPNQLSKDDRCETLKDADHGFFYQSFWIDQMR